MNKATLPMCGGKCGHRVASPRRKYCAEGDCRRAALQRGGRLRRDQRRAARTLWEGDPLELAGRTYERDMPPSRIQRIMDEGDRRSWNFDGASERSRRLRSQS